MKINLRIEQLVIHGADLTRREREQLAQTVQRELTQLIQRDPVGRPGTSQSPTSANRGNDAGSRLGPQIARAVYAQLPSQALGRRPATGRTGAAR